MKSHAIDRIMRGMRWGKETIKTEKKIGKRQKKCNKERRKAACA